MATDIETVDNEDEDPDSAPLVMRDAGGGGGLNPFKPPTNNGALAGVEEMRAITEVKAAIFMARECPRNEHQAMERILAACGQSLLAEAAMYAYPKGGTMVTGESIRLAEALRLYWGNIDSGWRELSETPEKAVVQAYAWELESNARTTRAFSVNFIRNTKQGSYPLKDERERYELKANMAARRERACILAMIPSYVRENAVKRCELTLKTAIKITPETVQALVDKFAEFGVTKKMLEARIQRTFDPSPGKDKNGKPIVTYAIWPAHVLQFRKIYNSLKDGMATVDQFFDAETASTTGVIGAVEQKTKADGVRARAAALAGDEPKTVEQPAATIAPPPGPESKATLEAAIAERTGTTIADESEEPEEQVDDEKSVDDEESDDTETVAGSGRRSADEQKLYDEGEEYAAGLKLSPPARYDELVRAEMAKAGSPVFTKAMLAEVKRKVIAEVRDKKGAQK